MTTPTTLSINFEGWCQIRLPTNPDPPDEPRGVSGYTFALADEPDLDRVIRFHDAVAPRTHAETPNVRVRSVTLGGKEWNKARLLLDAPVNLLNEDGEPPKRPVDPKGPKFEERNYILTLPGDQPIDPFYIQVKSENNDIELARRQVLDKEGDPKKPIWEIDRERLKQFGSISFIMDSGDVAEATGILGKAGRIAFRQKRLELLKADLEKARKEQSESPTVIAALQKRISEFEHYDSEDRRTVALGACETRNFPLSGKNPRVRGETLLGGIVDREQDWLTEFWFGGWDCDGLVCYVKGMLAVPFRLTS